MIHLTQPLLNPFIAASPDFLLSCKCCGHGLLEVKSLHNVMHDKPIVQNLDYLEFDEDYEENLSFYYFIIIKKRIQKWKNDLKWVNIHIKLNTNQKSSENFFGISLHFVVFLFQKEATRRKLTFCFISGNL